MEDSGPERLPTAGPITRAAFALCGAPYAIVRLVPEEWGLMRASAMLLLMVMIYQCAVLFLVGMQLFNRQGAPPYAILAGALFLSGFVLSIDAFVVVRGSWFQSGLDRLREQFEDLRLGGGALQKALRGVSLALRILLTLGFSGLTSEAVNELVFKDDIAQQEDRAYLQENAPLLGTLKAQQQTAIDQKQNEVDAENTQVAQLSSQVTTLRQNAISPGSGDPRLQAAQKQLDAATTAKAKADSDLATAQQTASDELGGVLRPGLTTGKAGAGPARRAAQEQVSEAQTRDDAAGSALESARVHFDDTAKQVAASGDAGAQQAQEQAGTLEANLANERARLATLEGELKSLTDGREHSLRDALADAPDGVRRQGGLLSDLHALWVLAGENPEIRAMITLCAIVSGGLELAAVLATVSTFLPTVFSVLLVRDFILKVRDIASEVEQADDDRPARRPEAEVLPPTPGAGGSSTGTPEGTHGSDDAGVTPFRRPRGRPRRNPLN